LFHELVYDGINVDVIHAERTQAQVCHFSAHSIYSLTFSLCVECYREIASFKISASARFGC
jgi:hypothetical protein